MKRKTRVAKSVDDSPPEESVSQAHPSNGSAYKNCPWWINIPESGDFPVFPPDRHVGVPPGPNFDLRQNPSATGSGFPSDREVPILEFRRTPQNALDIYWLRRDIWAASDRAKVVLEQMDRDAFAFADTVTRCANGAAAPHYWLVDVVHFRDALDLSGPEVSTKPYDDGLTWVSVLFAKKLRFRSRDLHRAKIWRQHQPGHWIFAAEAAVTRWNAETPKLRGIRWGHIGTITDD